MSTRPIKHCYWVIPGKILAGEYPRNLAHDSSLLKIRQLTDAGVSVFIDLTEEDEGLQPYAQLLGKAIHRRFPIPDVSVPQSPEFTTTILDAIDHHIEQNQLVYIHCWGGVGRTGVIVGCWLARNGYPGRKALDRLRQIWRQCPKSSWKESPETSEQENYIKNWGE